VDIGGSKIETALIDSTGMLLAPKARIPVPFENGLASLDRTLDILGAALDTARATPGHFAGLSIGICGMVDGDGLVSVAPNLHWFDVPLGAAARNRFGLPVRVGIDTWMAALGEATFGAGRGVPNFAWLTIGTGMGSCVVLNGAPYGGDRGFAGTIGHITVDEIHGPPCGCGRRGCLECYAAGWAIGREAQAAIDMGHDTILRDMARLGGGSVTAPMVFQAEAQGDPVAVHIIGQVVRYVGRALGTMVNLLDISLVIVGGGVGHAGRDFLARAEAEARSHCFSRVAAAALRVVPESLPNAALFGCAADVFARVGA
jgi:glucokinase